MHKNIIRMKRLTASEITPAGCSTSLYCTPGLQQTTAASAPLITDQSHLQKRGVQIKSANELLSGKTNVSVWRREDHMWNTRRQLCAADDFTGVFFGFPLICYSFMPMQVCKGGCLPPMDTSQRDLFINPWVKKTKLNQKHRGRERPQIRLPCRCCGRRTI